MIGWTTNAQASLAGAISEYRRLVLDGDREEIGRRVAIEKLRTARDQIDEAIEELEGEKP